MTAIGPIAASMRRPYSLRSILFDGTNEFISLGTATGLAFERTVPFSVSYWFRKDTDATTRAMVNRCQDTTLRGWQLEVFSNGINFILRNTITTTEAHIFVSPLTPNDGAWHHVVGTYDGSSSTDGMELYYDGTLASKGVSVNTLGTNTIVPASATAKIGGTSGVVSNMLGRMDDVSIWNKELSAAEVGELYNNGRPGNLDLVSMAANRVRWWRMGDGATFPTIPDEDGSGDDGTMTNMESGDIVAVVAGL